MGIKRVARLITAIAFLAVSATFAAAEWATPDECNDPDDYTFDGQTEACSLQIVQESRCAYACPHVPATVYKYLNPE